MTEKTRVPAVVRKDTAQRAEQDIPTVFSDHPTSIEPKGNPFGNTPLPPPARTWRRRQRIGERQRGAGGGGSASGSAAPAGAGSAAKPGTGKRRRGQAGRAGQGQGRRQTDAHGW